MKQQHDTRLPFAPPLPSAQFTLALIKEELKSRKFFNTLRKMGLDNSYLQPHLDALILQTLGLDDDSDSTFDVYYHIMERRSKKMKNDDQSVTAQAWKAYYELLNESEKRMVAARIVK